MAEPTSPYNFLEGEVLFFDKPYGWTSFALVHMVRKLLSDKLGVKKLKVGHAGTLDPLATGLMIICTGKATREIDKFQDLEKEYEAGVKLGATTPSFDLETEIDRVFETAHINAEGVQSALHEFLGEQLQSPPLFSAKMVDGTRAYKLARKGKSAVLAPKSIRIDEIELLRMELPVVHFRVKCSKGTYIRAMARDLGEKLGTGGHLISLKRTSIGPYNLGHAFDYKIFESSINFL